VLSVEAIFLAVFILMSQNRAARIRGKRSLLDLQLNLLAEQENTKMVEMLEQIGKAVGADFGSSEAVRVFEEATQPEALSDQIEQAVSGGEKRSGAE
jgi:uncharacterized membrane protein